MADEEIKCQYNAEKRANECVLNVDGRSAKVVVSQDPETGRMFITDAIGNPDVIARLRKHMANLGNRT